MKYRVEVICKMLETYEVEAENEDEALENWGEGRLVATDDDIECDIMNVQEISSSPIVIEVRGGIVQAVLNVPEGIEYEVKDYDNMEGEAA